MNRNLLRTTAACSLYQVYPRVPGTLLYVVLLFLLSIKRKYNISKDIPYTCGTQVRLRRRIIYLVYVLLKHSGGVNLAPQAAYGTTSAYTAVDSYNEALGCPIAATGR